MSQRIAAAILVLFVSFAALAQKPPAPCSGAVNPLFTVTTGNPVQLTFEHLTSHTLSAPQVNIAGKLITVLQWPTDMPLPPAAAAAADLNCNAQTVSLGALPSGGYNVTWSYSLPSPIPNGQPMPIESHTFSFAIAGVPALSGGALAGLLLALGALGVVTLRR